MKKGFLKNRVVKGSSESQVTSGAVVSTEPRIICSDPSLAQFDVAHILFIPPQQPQIALVDTLKHCREIAKWPVWRSYLPGRREGVPSEASEPLVVVEDIAGKGRGMVAKALIKAGTLVLSEKPIFVINASVSRSASHTNENGILQDLGISGLAKEKREKFMELKNSFPERNPTVGRLSTNYLTIDLSPTPDLASEVRACFETLSRANHSCMPNANYFFHFPTFSGQFWAMRDIQAGEEITIMYVNILQGTAERQADTQRLYRFVCSCSACNVDETARKRSDVRRRVLGSLSASIDDPSKMSSLSFAHLSSALQWATKEECWGQIPRIRMAGIGVLFTERKSQEARIWTQEAKSAFQRIEGPGTDNVKNMAEILRKL
ncbi:hypothetical protein DFH06DRAFT_1012975 [Mycena polygramma]|nr:hypothetical protein DFH06DRAFT_1012975 [Mycena polygramma]